MTSCKALWTSATTFLILSVTLDSSPFSISCIGSIPIFYSLKVILVFELSYFVSKVILRLSLQGMMYFESILPQYLTKAILIGDTASIQ
jgi:hypothetical protein